MEGSIRNTTAVKDGHLKRDRPPDSIVSAFAEAMNRAEFHQQRESGMGKGTIKKKVLSTQQQTFPINALSHGDRVKLILA